MSRGTGFSEGKCAKKQEKSQSHHRRAAGNWRHKAARRGSLLDKKKEFLGQAKGNQNPNAKA